MKQDTLWVKGILGLFICYGLVLDGWALDPHTQDPRKIMAVVEGRDRGNNITATLEMRIIDAKKRERSRVIKLWSKEFKDAKKTLMLFSHPADVKNTGLLSVDYLEAGKSDDQWLYLPSLRKTSRISGGDKSGSFMGSDLTYNDMATKDIAAYDYILLEADVKVAGESCWLIESRPKTPQEQEETGYIKSKLWISKGKLIPLQLKAWVKEGKKIKYIKFDDIKQVGGIWIPHQILVKTTRKKVMVSMTIITYQAYLLNQEGIADDLFTLRRLTKGL